MATPDELRALSTKLTGELHTGDLMRKVYSTDASIYQQLPLAVAIPAHKSDLRVLIKFANQHGIGLIPRTAGTSLAGQVVGSGIVVDVSRTFTEILEINPVEGWVRCQPGVIRNELNMALESHGLLFGPETSTQNRAMLGGMLGNNSCGSNSVKYGSVRDHILQVTALLSDGSEAVFGPLSAEEFVAKCNGPDGLETQIYRDVYDLLADSEVRHEIVEQFPKPTIPRRNTGYALDLLMDATCFDATSSHPFNFGKLIAGSEGTLCLVTEMKLHCDRLPPAESGLLCAHFETVNEALRATQIAVGFDCFACELIDKYILDCTKRSLEHRENRFFLEGDPGAVLVIEIRGKSQDEVLTVTNQIEASLRDNGLGNAFPVLFGDDAIKVWNLRKAGLGLLSNVPGDDKPTSVVEDTAVDVSDLPEYIAEFNRQLDEQLGLDCVHYAHAGSGEIHLRPVLNLKTESGHRKFRQVAEMIADLVKKYRGSLSGEHGDGRLRGEFLRRMIGEKNYRLVERVKRSWDPNSIFNPGKIVNTPPMDSQLRFAPSQTTPEIETVFDWSATNGVVRAAEQCNGSGDCRKTHLSGGTMCPSYMATRNEKDTTRARANMLRNVLTGSTKDNPFDSEELKDILDLCLSCKGCKKECPSSVDMAKLKAEFQQHYYDAHGIPFRTRLIGNFNRSQRIASWAPWLWNLLFGTAPVRRLLNRMIGFHADRTIPLLSRQTLRRWFSQHKSPAEAGSRGEVLFFCDEFTNYIDVEIGKTAVKLLEQLGYKVTMPDHGESGRSWLSKGLVRQARQRIGRNVELLGKEVTANRPLIGIEPSAILTFRDEALELFEEPLKSVAHRMAPHCLMLEEFIVQEMNAGRLTPDLFTAETRQIRLHGHCFQKALVGVNASLTALSLPVNYQVSTIPSGCCGMAGSFGYEREHYQLSMDIAELVLLPAVRNAVDEVVAAPGTSCRHQIHDGTGKRARHPAEILFEALK
ncbi:MAG TPA: FAD-binding oxidoreductase [Planctomycetaceae bacterium]|nr:FAD-binding oxidoreductase [Planctomycetaceae bacterium]